MLLTINDYCQKANCATWIKYIVLLQYQVTVLLLIFTRQRRGGWIVEATWHLSTSSRDGETATHEGGHFSPASTEHRGTRRNLDAYALLFTLSRHAVLADTTLHAHHT